MNATGTQPVNLIEILLAFAAALAVCALLTKLLIPYFKKKQFGQYIREEGPQGHLKKQGTPTMGGIGIIAAITIGILCGGDFIADKIAIIVTMLAFAIIGFIDDYNKIAKKDNLGLTAKQKLGLQILFSVLIAVYMIVYRGRTDVYIPFAKVYIDFGLLFIPFVIFVEVAMANAVNLTDGLDGLSSSVTAIVGAAFVGIGLSAPFAKTDPVLAISGAAVAGALIGFLFFNRFPAKIFMGDTGSMALGGFLSAVAITTKTEFLLPIVGLVYVIEVLSVIIQVLYFRKTGGKRFFRMAPIHHHFELGGLSERQVVARFDLFTVVMCIIAFLATVPMK